MRGYKAGNRAYRVTKPTMFLRHRARAAASASGSRGGRVAAGAVRAFERLAWAWCLIAGAWIAGGSGAVAAAPPPPPEGLSEAERAEWEEVAAYVDGVFERGKRGTVYPQSRLTFKEHITYVPDEAEMAMLRERAEKEPESMGAGLFRRYEAASRGQYYTLSRKLWIIDADSYRINHDSPNNSEPGESIAVDSVFDNTKNLLWRMGNGELNIIEATANEIQESAKRFERTFALSVLDFIDPGFGQLIWNRPADGTVNLTVVHPGLYVAKYPVEFNGGGTVSIAFSWDMQRMKPIVNRFRYDVSTQFNPSIGIDFEYSEHEWRDYSQTYICRTVIHRNRNGEIVRRNELMEFAELTRAEFDDIAAIPTVLRPDPVRGELGLRDITEVTFGNSMFRNTPQNGEQHDLSVISQEWVTSFVPVGIGLVIVAIVVVVARRRISL